MFSERPYCAFLLFASALLISIGTSADAAAEVPHCPDENEAMLSDGTIRIQQFQALGDPTSGGKLKGVLPESPDRPLKVVLLLDYSGSMYPGYGKARPAGCGFCGGEPEFYFRQPAFTSLLARWLDAATPTDLGQGLEILLFNSRVWRLGKSGVEPYRGPEQLLFDRRLGSAAAGKVEDWLKEIPASPYETDPAAPKVTESERALLSVLEAIPDEALVWMVTDNIVDRGGVGASSDDAKRNLAFYDLISHDPRIQMVAAYPLHQAEACSWMCGTSLFVYGFHVSRFQRPDSRETRRLAGAGSDGGPAPGGLLWNPALKALAAENSGASSSLRLDLAGVPLRLKPVDADVLSFEFKLHQGSQALRCSRGTEIGETLRCAIEATVRNTLRHQRVDAAKLSFRNETMLPRKFDEQNRLAWASALCAGQMRSIAWRVNGVKVTQDGNNLIEIGPLAPLETKVVEAIFEAPAIEVDTSLWRNAFDIARTDQIILDGRVVAEVRDIRTRLAVETQGLEKIYGAPELPRIFHGQEQSSIEAIYPAGAVVANNGQVLGLLVVLGGGGLVSLLALILMRYQRLHLEVVVDGVPHSKVSLPRLSLHWISLGGAARALVVRGWGKEIRLRPGAGLKVRKDGSTWLLVHRGGGADIRVDFRRGWGGGRRSRQPGEAGDRW